MVREDNGPETKHKISLPLFFWSKTSEKKWSGNKKLEKVCKETTCLISFIDLFNKKNPGCPLCFRSCQMLCQISKSSHKVAVVFSYPSVPLVSGGHTSLGFWSLSDSFQIYPLTHTGGGTARGLKQWTEARQSCIQSKLEKLSLQWLSCCYLPKK